MAGPTTVLDLSDWHAPFTNSLELTAADVAWPIILPLCNQVDLQFPLSDGKYSFTGEQDADLGTDYHTAPADTVVSINTQGFGKPFTLYVQTAAIKAPALSITCLP